MYLNRSAYLFKMTHVVELRVEYMGYAILKPLESTE